MHIPIESDWRGEGPEAAIIYEEGRRAPQGKRQSHKENKYHRLKITAVGRNPRMKVRCREKLVQLHGANNVIGFLFVREQFGNRTNICLVSVQCRQTDLRGLDKCFLGYDVMQWWEERKTLEILLTKS